MSYFFPCRHGWTITKELDYVHASGARTEREQIEGDDDLHYVVQYWAVMPDSERRGPFRKAGEALRAAVPVEVVPVGQLWLPGVRAA